jgi:hypothetical protein
LSNTYSTYNVVLDIIAYNIVAGNYLIKDHVLSTAIAATLLKVIALLVILQLRDYAKHRAVATEQILDVILPNRPTGCVYYENANDIQYSAIMKCI